MSVGVSERAVTLIHAENDIEEGEEEDTIMSARRLASCDEEGSDDDVDLKSNEQKEDKENELEALEENLYLETLNQSSEPSIYLVAAAGALQSKELQKEVRIRLDAFLLLPALTLIVFSVQVIFPLFFLINFVNRRKPRLLAPGFHTSRRKSRRVHWFHNFFGDAAASIFLLYVLWSVWQYQSFAMFRMLSRTKSFRSPWTAVGLIAQLSTVFLVPAMTYILFRLASSPADMTLNALALTFIIDFDTSVTNQLSKDPSLRKLLHAATDTILTETKMLMHGERISKMAWLAKASIRQLWKPASNLGKSIRRGDRCIEFIFRFFIRQIFFYWAFLLWICQLTGGHIAHSHIRQILWFFHLVNSPTSKAETDRVPLKDIATSSNSNQDRQYVPMALIFSTLSYLAFLLLFYYMTRRDRTSFFRKRNQEEKSIDKLSSSSYGTKQTKKSLPRVRLKGRTSRWQRTS